DLPGGYLLHAGSGGRRDQPQRPRQRPSDQVLLAADRAHPGRGARRGLPGVPHADVGPAPWGRRHGEGPLRGAGHGPARLQDQGVPDDQARAASAQRMIMGSFGRYGLVGYLIVVARFSARLACQDVLMAISKADEAELAAKFAVMRPFLDERAWRVYLGTGANAMG